MRNTATKLCSKDLLFCIFAIIALSRHRTICFATAKLQSPRQEFYPVDTPVYKSNVNKIDQWIEGMISSFDTATNTYEILWSNISVEYIDAETTDTFVYNKKSYDKYKFQQNGEEVESLLKENYDNHARFASEVVDGDNVGDMQQWYESGISVSKKNDDGTWKSGEITVYEEGSYTIEWEDGEVYVVSAEDGELDQMVEDSITQSIPDDDEIGYLPSEMGDTIDSSVMAMKESTIILFIVAGMLVVVGYVRHKKLVAISSTKISGNFWGNNGESGTHLSLQMDDHRNLHSTRSIV